ncbi:uncharacterized protein PG998_014788 [Apiospora kogelbergensis]|uniref:uncharacterized protein n=1 Tax=Apiospora kogelbergensis TaxID=1337665 RepID=UPI00312D69B2
MATAGRDGPRPVGEGLPRRHLVQATPQPATLTCSWSITTIYLEGRGPVHAQLTGDSFRYDVLVMLSSLTELHTVLVKKRQRQQRCEGLLPIQHPYPYQCQDHSGVAGIGVNLNICLPLRSSAGPVGHTLAWPILASTSLPTNSTSVTSSSKGRSAKLTAMSPPPRFVVAGTVASPSLDLPDSVHERHDLLEIVVETPQAPSFRWNAAPSAETLNCVVLEA